MNQQPSTPRVELLSAELSAEAIQRAQITRVQLAPGQAAGLHSHPCHVVGIVLSGRIRFEVEGGQAKMLAAGDAFHEPQGARIAHFDNCSATEPAVFAAVYLLPPSVEHVVDMLTE